MWSRARARTDFMEACTTSSATTAWTRTTGSPIGTAIPFRRCAATITASPFGGPIFKNKTFFFFDYDGLRSSGLSTATQAVPTDLMRAGDFGEVCAAQGGDVRYERHDAAWTPVRFGTHIPELSMKTLGELCAATFIPFNNIAAYTSPGSPNLPANLQPPWRCRQSD